MRGACDREITFPTGARLAGSDAGFSEPFSNLTVGGQELTFVGRSMIFSENRSKKRPAPLGIMFW
jgi:hypothetical protein